MRDNAATYFRRASVLTGLLVGLIASGTGAAQLGLPGLPPVPPLPGPGGGGTATLTGGASAVSASVLGTVTQFAATGTLDSASEPLGTGLGSVSVPGLSAEALHATTMGWTDQVVSEASLGNLAMTVAGTGIAAEFVLSRAQAVAGSGGTGASTIEGLSIAGSPIVPTAAPNQVISLPGVTVILNEQIQSVGGILVNALHIRTLDGAIDVVVGAAKAGI
jgi:hypothetical protein